MHLADVRWRHGCGDPAACEEPPLEVHRLDDATYVLRQSKCLHFEAPFLYLLLGEMRALLLDTGAEPVAGRTLPLRETVEGILAGTRDRATIELVVAHTHDHDDHVFGDAQFEGQPCTTLVRADQASVRRFFGLSRWPEGHVTFDLGGRLLTLLPTPGHEPAHIAIHDPRSGILFSGDTLYPGILTVRDFPAFRESAARLHELATRERITHVLGGHVEMTRRPGVSYAIGCTYQPDEHPLPLQARHVRELHEACEALAGAPREDVHDAFVIRPVAR